MEGLNNTSLPAGQQHVGSPRMPAFATGTHAHIHSLHSALATLDALRVGAHRTSIYRTGREGVAAGTVVAQSPAPGSPLLPDTLVRLWVAGLGFTHALPVGMWDSGGETHAGTREIFECLDDPLEKLKHWFHEGAPLFRISAEDPAACARWLMLFGIDPEVWPRSLWFPLATLAAGMAQYSCSRDGCAFVLATLLGLPVSAFCFRPRYAMAPRHVLSALGKNSSRLGVDLVVGDRIEEPALIEVEIGPVPLETYEQYVETPGGAALLQRTFDLVMPVSNSYQLRWQVLDAGRAPRLGVPGANSRLGINTHMGQELGIPASGAAAEQPAKTGPHF